MIAGTNTVNGQLQQNYSFAEITQNISFAGIPLAILPGSIKWSVNIRAIAAPFTKGINIGYDLTSLESSSSTAISSLGPVTQTTSNNLTTYIITISPGIAIKVQVLDVALVDGIIQTIQHSISYNNQSGITLLLSFPPFNNTLEYDPVLNMVSISTSGGGGGGNSGSSDTGLIVGLTVGLVGGAALLASGITIALLLLLMKKRTAKHSIAVDEDGL